MKQYPKSLIEKVLQKIDFFFVEMNIFLLFYSKFFEFFLIIFDIKI